MATKPETKNGKAKQPTNRISDALDAPATMRPEILTFDIVGISPLLQNNPANFIGAVEDDALIAGKKEYKDAEEAELRVYKAADGSFYHPSQAFTKAMLRAVTGKKFGKQTATTLIKGAVFITEPYATLLDAKGKPLTKYTIDRQPVIVGKARVLRCRPCFPEWRIRLALEVDMAMLQEAHVREALSLAGRIVGIGDYRPEKTGGFGRFKVE